MKYSLLISISVFLLLFCSQIQTHETDSLNKNTTQSSANQTAINATSEDQGVSIELACLRCKYISEEFETGLKNTENSTYIGGNSDWEKRSLIKYQDSETRMHKILDQICPNSPNESKCYIFLEENEQLIEQFWNDKRKQNVSFYQEICVDTLEICCPLGHYGPNCEQCPGITDDFTKPCNKMGTCDGVDTRAGKGTCTCGFGYDGESCEKCAEDHYRDEFDECKSCHPSCKGNCTGPGENECPPDNCVNGYKYNSDSGICEDIDECLDEELAATCNENQYCQNEPSKFSCLNCDISCAGCTSYGSKSCKKCAENYQLEDGSCKIIDESMEEEFDELDELLDDIPVEDYVMDIDSQKKLSIFKKNIGNKNDSNGSAGKKSKEESGSSKNDDSDKPKDKKHKKHDHKHDDSDKPKDKKHKKHDHNHDHKHDNSDKSKDKKYNKNLDENGTKQQDKNNKKSQDNQFIPEFKPHSAKMEL